MTDRTLVVYLLLLHLSGQTIVSALNIGNVIKSLSAIDGITALLGKTNGSKVPYHTCKEFAENQYIVAFHNESTLDEILGILTKSPVQLDDIFSHLWTFKEVMHAVVITIRNSTLELLRRLETHVKYIQQDCKVHAADLNVDVAAAVSSLNLELSAGINAAYQNTGQCYEQTEAQWCLSRCSNPTIRTQAPFNYNYPGYQGNGVIIFVLDTGVNIDHPEFFNGTYRRAFAAPSFVPNNSDRYDRNGHGTAVASAAAGKLAGVAKEATIISVKVLDDNKLGLSSWVIRGLEWTNQYGRARKLKGIINMSLSYLYDEALNNAVNQIIQLGFFVVAAAGNAEGNACDYTPSSVTRAVKVGSTNKDNQLAWFTNYGSCVDLFAPGQDCLIANISGYTQVYGTSISTPYVSGWAALLLNGEAFSREKLIERMSAKVLLGVIQGDVKGSRNQFIGVTCPIL